MTTEITAKPTMVASSAVHCPMCTHTVEALVVTAGQKKFVKAGQKCARCNSSLDAAYVLSYDRAA
jgi:uncharacterized protein (UPF0212 family)